jgi:hypothetical protein
VEIMYNLNVRVKVATEDGGISDSRK